MPFRYPFWKGIYVFKYVSFYVMNLDTDQETWSVRSPHDKQKSLQKMERWNVMVSSKENEQSEKHKNCEIQRFIEFRT